MKELQRLVKEINVFTAKNKQIDLETSEGRQRMADRIDNYLSPENLCCDGEASPSYVQSRFRFLNKCAEQLRELDPSVRFNEVF